MNTAKFLGIESKIDENAKNSFTDNKQISTWAIEAVHFCSFNSIMSGTGNNLFIPKANYSREMSISTIVRLYRLISSSISSMEASLKA